MARCVLWLVLLVAANALANEADKRPLALLRDGQSPARQAPKTRLMQLAGSWSLSSSTFPGSDGATFVAREVAGGLAIQSVWTHGSGDSRYEANALWGYDAASRQVRVFEVNSLGVAALHVGAFTEAGALVLDQEKDKDGSPTRHTTFTWTGDTMRMDASFYGQSTETKHSATLVRRR